MLEWDLLVFVLAVVTISLTPGPDMLFILANAIRRGARAGFLSALGIGGAMLVHTTAAALGLSYLFSRSAWAFELVRYAGAAYLIWLGVQALKGSEAVTDDPRTEAVPAFDILRQGFFTNLLNPKVIVFFAAFLPQFVVPDAGSITGQFLILGALFTGIGFLIDGGIGVMSGKAGDLLLRRRNASLFLGRASGAIFIGLGVRLLFIRPPT